MSPMLKKYIIFLHAVTECDRRQAVTIIENSVLHLVINTPANIADIGEKFLLLFCEATKKTLQNQVNMASKEQCSNNSLCVYYQRPQWLLTTTWD